MTEKEEEEEEEEEGQGKEGRQLFYLAHEARFCVGLLHGRQVDRVARARVGMVKRTLTAAAVVAPPVEVHLLTKHKRHKHRAHTHQRTLIPHHKRVREHRKMDCLAGVGKTRR